MRLTSDMLKRIIREELAKHKPQPKKLVEQDIIEDVDVDIAIKRARDALKKGRQNEINSTK